jgi:hypothetical protein
LRTGYEHVPFYLPDNHRVILFIENEGLIMSQNTEDRSKKSTGKSESGKSSGSKSGSTSSGKSSKK